MNGRIHLSATLDSIAAKKNGTIVQLVLDGYVPPEDVADLYRMRGKTVAVQIVDPEQPLPLEYDDKPEPELAGTELAVVE